MKKLIFLFSIVILYTNLSAQSLESQLKLVFGDFLADNGKNNFSRELGKALVTSGTMQYDMERIKAQNNQTITINHNLPPNTYLDPNNQIRPNQGYEWANDVVGDYTVVPVSISANPARSTLPAYDLGILQRNSERYSSSWKDFYSTLTGLFTYNWQADLNGDNDRDISEFNGIKRTFHLGEPVCFAFIFRAKCGSKDPYKQVEKTLNNLKSEIESKQNKFDSDLEYYKNSVKGRAINNLETNLSPLEESISRQKTELTILRTRKDSLVNVNILDKINFLIQIFDNSTGKIIARENFEYYDINGPSRFQNNYRMESLGESLPVGKYFMSVSIISSKYLSSSSVKSIREKFEVIE